MVIQKLSDPTIAEHFLKNCFSSPTHWPEWNLLVSKYYKLQFYYLGAYEQNELVGICPIFETVKKHVTIMSSGQVYYVPYGGWIFNKPMSFNLKDYPLKLNQTVSGYSLPLIEDFNTHYIQPENHSFFSRLELTDNQFQTLLVDLSSETDYIWNNSIDSKRRNMFRKAEKLDLHVEIIEKDSFEEFYSFYSEMNIKYGLENLDKECMFELLFNTNQITFKVFVIRYNGSIINCLVLTFDKNYALYWIGLNQQGIPNMGQGELLQWEAILYAKNIGCSYYDLCYIEKEKLPNIYEFKKGFSKYEVPIIHFSRRPLSYRIINKIFK